MNLSNAKRLVKSLSRMRGAALKLGQMLSIQDETLLPSELTNALERVRNSADIMPEKQLEVRELPIGNLICNTIFAVFSS